MHVTRKESLFLDRKRRQESQAEAARRLGIPEYIYGQMENGVHSIGKEFLPKIIGLSEVEKCIIKRKREAMTQDELAEEIGCSRYWVIRMENGNAPETLLLDYWNAK